MIPPGETGQIFIPEGELLFGPVDGIVESFAYLSIRKPHPPSPLSASIPHRA